MAKGRRLTSSRSDRLLGTGGYNYYDHDLDHDHGYHENGTGAEVSEFGEADVWSMVDDTSDNNHRHHNYPEWDPRATVESGRRRVGGSVVSHHQQEEKHVGGLSLAFEDKSAPSSRRILHQYGGATGAGGGGPRASRHVASHVASSAPVNVPDWSKILRVNSVESCVDSDENDDHLEGGSAIEPPHEYLARSRKTMNAFSVFEGVGRTLKGRDMTRVRDAIWSQTGFEG